MKVHIRQIPNEGLQVEGEEDSSILDLQTEEIRAVGPVRYELAVGTSEDGLFASGTLAVDLEFECVACLRRFIRAIRVDDFAMQTPLEGRETVNLTEFVREDIVLALPPHPHCDWDGQRVCPGVKAPGTQPLPKPDVWGELDKLKIRSRN